jgi:hypothetical protein
MDAIHALGEVPYDDGDGCIRMSTISDGYIRTSAIPDVTDDDGDDALLEQQAVEQEALDAYEDENRRLQALQDLEYVDLDEHHREQAALQSLLESYETEQYDREAAMMSADGHATDAESDAWLAFARVVAHRFPNIDLHPHCWHLAFRIARSQEMLAEYHAILEAERQGDADEFEANRDAIEASLWTDMAHDRTDDTLDDVDHVLFEDFFDWAAFLDEEAYSGTYGDHGVFEEAYDLYKRR